MAPHCAWEEETNKAEAANALSAGNTLRILEFIGLLLKAGGSGCCLRRPQNRACRKERQVKVMVKFW
jgi:hypothetical protein